MSTTDNTRQDGYTLLVAVTLLVPLLITAAAFSSAMFGRGDELRVEHDEELALLTAEAGVDDAIYRGRTGDLTAGTYSRSFGSSRAFTVVATYLGSDGKDNDKDEEIDEADEDVYQVVVTGRYRRTTRRLAAYLGPVPLLPSMVSAMATMDPAIVADIKGTPRLSGYDLNINGTPGPGPDVPGLTIAPPGTVDHLMSELTPSEQSSIVGSSPSIDLSAAVDVPTLVAQIKNIANLVLTSSHYGSYQFGDASAGTTNIAYRDGDLTISGNSRGAGILVVTGDLEVRGNLRFDGVIIALGNVYNSSGTALIYGSILQGPSGGMIQTKGTFDLHYSSEAIALANSISGRYVAFNGWQELARK